MSSGRFFPLNSGSAVCGNAFIHKLVARFIDIDIKSFFPRCAPSLQQYIVNTLNRVEKERKKRVPEEPFAFVCTGIGNTTGLIYIKYATRLQCR